MKGGDRLLQRFIRGFDRLELVIANCVRQSDTPCRKITNLIALLSPSLQFVQNLGRARSLCRSYSRQSVSEFQSQCWSRKTRNWNLSIGERDPRIEIDYT